MAENFRTTITLDGKALKSVSRISLNQTIFAHHHFNVELPLSSLVKIEKDEDPFPALKGCIGRPVEITIGTATDADRDGHQDESVFKGLVTDVSVSGHRWEHSMVTLKGNSPTVLIDGIENAQAFAQKGIKQIYEACAGKHLSNEIKMSDNLSYTDNLMFTAQYNETDFDFIKRLCFQYGEWCYYDGSEFCLGLKPTKKTISLKKERLLDLEYSYALAAPRPKVIFRDYKKHSTKELKTKKVSFKDDMASHSFSESGNMFPGSGESSIQVPSHLSGESLQNEEKQLQYQLDAAQKSAMSRVLTVSGSSDVAGIGVGSVIRLEGLKHSGDFLVINITHSCMDAKSYSNHFVAIPKDAQFPAGTHIDFPEVRECSAVVSDNKDPKKLGRVKVLFDWSPDTESPWLRMITSHAGDSRGLYFVPEEGDEVMVGFEMGNPDYPYVIGSLYNGKYNFGKNAQDNNNLKSIKTKSGNEILFDDGGQIIIRNEHNSFELICKEDGKIVLKTDGDMEFTAGKKMAFSSGEEMAINAGADLSIGVGGKMAAQAGAEMTLEASGDGKLSSGGDLQLTSTGDLKGEAGGNLELKGTVDANISGVKTVVKGSATAELSSGGINTIKGSLVKIN